MRATCSLELREDHVQPDSELLQDARSLREGLWQMAQDANEALELLDSRIDAEDLDGESEAGELRSVARTPFRQVL